MKNGKLITGILLGAAVGAAAIILTKRKRSKSLNKLSKKGADIRDHFRSKMNKFENDSREKLASLKADAKHALS